MVVTAGGRSIAAGIAAMATVAFMAAAPVSAAELTNNECLGVLSALRSLRYAGEPLEPLFARMPPVPAGALPYRLGPSRLTLALDQRAAEGVLSGLQEAQKQFIETEAGEEPKPPTGDKDKPIEPAAMKAFQEQHNAWAAKADANFAKMLAKPCNVNFGRVPEEDLGMKVNEFPLEVLNLLVPIIDKAKVEATAAPAK